MSADFQSGQKFFAQIEQVKPDNAQKLLALLSDSVGADDELASAFRLLFANPVYVSLFLGRKRPSSAEFTSLSSISSRSLSSALAARVHNFVSGYFASCRTDESCIDSEPSGLNQSVPNRSASTFPSSARSSSLPDLEEPTLFVDDSASNEEASFGVSTQDGDKPERPKAAAVPVKPIVLACAAIIVLIASFKVPAICEPFGLCEKKSETPKDKKSEPESKDKPVIPSVEPEDPPVAVPADPPASPSPPKVLDPLPQRSEAPVRSRPPAATPSREVAPMREQPLW